MGGQDEGLGSSAKTHEFLEGKIRVLFGGLSRKPKKNAKTANEGGTSHLTWMMSKWTYRFSSVFEFYRTFEGVFFKHLSEIIHPGGCVFGWVEKQKSTCGSCCWCFFLGISELLSTEEMGRFVYASRNPVSFACRFGIAKKSWKIHPDLLQQQVGIHTDKARLDKSTQWKMNIINMDQKVMDALERVPFPFDSEMFWHPCLFSGVYTC